MSKLEEKTLIEYELMADSRRSDFYKGGPLSKQSDFKAAKALKAYFTDSLGNRSFLSVYSVVRRYRAARRKAEAASAAFATAAPAGA